MIRADIEEQVRIARYCVKIDHRHEACDWLGRNLIKAQESIEKLRRAVEIYQEAERVRADKHRNLIAELQSVCCQVEDRGDAATADLLGRAALALEGKAQ